MMHACFTKKKEMEKWKFFFLHPLKDAVAFYCNQMHPIWRKRFLRMTVVFLYEIFCIKWRDAVLLRNDGKYCVLGGCRQKQTNRGSSSQLKLNICVFAYEKWWKMCILHKNHCQNMHIKFKSINHSGHLITINLIKTKWADQFIHPSTTSASLSHKFQ